MYLTWFGLQCVRMVSRLVAISTAWIWQGVAFVCMLQRFTCICAYDAYLRVGCGAGEPLGLRLGDIPRLLAGKPGLPPHQQHLSVAFSEEKVKRAFETVRDTQHRQNSAPVGGSDYC